MAYVPSFEHDVFISYAHADNETARVSAFHRDLVQRLTIRLGARAFHKPKEWVFFDRFGLKAGDEISPSLERAATRSAVLISLVSPSYLQAPYCIKETEWFLESKARARDPIERRLIPVLLNSTPEADLGRFTQLTADLLRESLCKATAAHEPSSAEWNAVLETLANQIADHLRKAREKHGAVYVGQAYGAVENVRAGLVDELRGFRCVPENATFGQEQAQRQALAEAKLAVHFLGDSGAEAVGAAEAILWSLEHCRGKTIGYLAPGQRLADDERQFLDEIRSHPQWTQPECTPTELAQILTLELEGFRLPDPATPIALACDPSDLSTVQQMAREIHSREQGAFTVGTPDFLGEPGALSFIGWKKLLTKTQSVIVYWGSGQKQYLDTNIARYLAVAKLGRAWYVSLTGPEPEGKRDWQPGDPATQKIVDEGQAFRYESLQPFLKSVRENARK